MGLDFNVFYELTWYEYILATRRHDLIERVMFRNEDMQWARFRIQWADFRNANRGKSAKTVRPEDLMKLSFDSDKPEEKKEALGPKRMKELMGGTFKKNGSE
jgi:hypothetical protein